MGKNRRLGIGHLAWLNHDVKLTTSLHGIRALNSIMSVRDLLKFLETLDVILGRLATSARTSGRNSVSGLNKNIKDAARLDIGMMRLNGVDNLRSLTIATSKISADHCMGALNLMVNGLTKVVQQASALVRDGINAKLRSHDSTKLGNLN